MRDKSGVTCTSVPTSCSSYPTWSRENSASSLRLVACWRSLAVQRTKGSIFWAQSVALQDTLYHLSDCHPMPPQTMNLFDLLLSPHHWRFLGDYFWFLGARKTLLPRRGISSNCPCTSWSCPWSRLSWQSHLPWIYPRFAGLQSPPTTVASFQPQSACPGASSAIFDRLSGPTSAYLLDTSWNRAINTLSRHSHPAPQSSCLLSRYRDDHY